jgi:hypothetical protein
MNVTAPHYEYFHHTNTGPGLDIIILLILASKIKYSSISAKIGVGNKSG